MLYIVLPAYNEEKNIGIILNNIYHLSKKGNVNLRIVVVIVNDGSTDNTEKNINKFVSSFSKSKKKLTIKKINHKKNKGLGAAIKSGFEYVVKISKNDDILISLDCDNTHPINLIYPMVKKIKSGRDVVIASRFKKNSKTIGVPLERKILSYAAAIIFKLLFPINNIKDYTCGYRAYRIHFLKQAMQKNKPFFSESGFSAMVDILLQLKKFNKDINAEELPMILRYDLKSGKSKMVVKKNIIQTLKLIIKRRFFN